jgi:hypothetical protein
VYPSLERLIDFACISSGIKNVAILLFGMKDENDEFSSL